MTSGHELAQEQELQLIGSLLKNPTKINLVKEIITPDDIWLIRAREVYESMLSLDEKGYAFDAVTVGDELERHDKLGSWGGRYGLQVLRNDFRGDEPESYAMKILDYSAKRKMIDEAGIMATWGNNGRDSAAIREDMIRRLTDIRTPNAGMDKHTATIKETLSSTYDRMNSGITNAVTTGFIDLDKMFYGGWIAPDFTIVAARPGQGKTSLLISMALSAAKAGKRVLLLSLEMSNEQVTMRMLSAETGVPFEGLITGKLTAAEWNKINEKIEELENYPIILNDMPAITPNSIRQTYRKHEALHGKIDLIVIDYLQLQGADGKYFSREQEVSSISKASKAMAKEFNTPVLAAAQLSRKVEERSEKKPILSDLRESGSLEQDADNVIFIYRPDQYEKDTAKQNTAELIVAKHRNGKVGSVELIFRAALTKFENSTARTFAPNGKEG